MYGHWRVGSECNAQCGLRYTEHRTQDIQSTQNIQNMNEQAQHSAAALLSTRRSEHTATANKQTHNKQRLHKEAAHTGTDEVDAVKRPPPRGDTFLSSEAGQRGGQDGDRR